MTSPPHDASLHRLAFHNSPVPMAMFRFENLDDPGSIRQIDCNDAACEVVAHDMHRDNGRLWSEISPELAESHFAPVFRRVVETGQPECYQISYGDREYRQGVWRGTVTRLADGLVLCVFDDCTAEIELERKRRDHRTRVLDLQEIERAALARELHDGIGQDLAALATLAELLERRQPNDHTNRLRTGLAQLVADLRRLSFGLHPPGLEERGLRRAMEELVRRTVTCHPETEVRVDVADPPPEVARCIERELAAYRIIQEALCNALRHGRPSRIEIRLERRPNRITGWVTDDGTGFDPASVSPGFGLYSMRERAELAGGTLRVSSPASEELGTEVHFTLSV